MTSKKEELLDKLSQGVLDVAFAILDDPMGWLKQVDDVINYWKCHTDIITQDILTDMIKLLIVVKRIEDRTDVLDHLCEKGYDNECCALFMDLFVAQNIINRIDPNVVDLDAPNRDEE